jgi:hypothetical protein
MPEARREERTYFQLLTYLERESGRRIDMQLNRNRVSYVSFEELSPGGRIRLRLQRAFLSAPEEVLAVLARWIRTCRGRTPVRLRRFIASTAEDDPRPRRAPARISTCGRFHDLASIMDRVNREYYRGQLKLRITWGRALNMNRRVHQRQLGSFDRERNLVTVSRVLDQEEVPDFFVAFVVFHEMLHAVQPESAGRDHDSEFRSVERLHPDYYRAARWQRRNLSVLMSPGKKRRKRKKPRGRRAAEPPGGPVQGVLF